MAKTGARRAKQKATPDVKARLEWAVSLHRQGKWRQAEPLYRKIVRQAPKNFIARHLLGLVALEKRDYDEAETLIRQALEINPAYPEALNNLGNVMLEQKRYEEALGHYDRALAIKPDAVDALNNRGSALLGMERYEEALASYDRALAVRPDFVDAQYNRGNALNALGRWEDALACYDNAIAVRPKYAEAHFNRGLVLIELDRREDALASFDRALASDRGYTNARRRRAQTLLALERWDEAQEECGRLLSQAPDDVVGLSCRGAAFFCLGRWEEALAAFDWLIALDPAYAEAHANRADALTELGRLDEALAACDAALAIQPDNTTALVNCGNVLARLDRPEDALESYGRALDFDPVCVDALTDRGNVLKEQGLVDLALACYARALAIAPDNALAQYNDGICRLLTGDFGPGWAQYEHRLRMPKFARSRRFDGPGWSGAEPLDGRTILLHAEQGLGDTIQFCRYAAMVAARGVQVVLEVQPPLKSLLAGLDGVDRVVGRGEPTPAHDLHCSLMSLPAAFGTTIETIPSSPSYLTPDAARADGWARRLGGRERPRVGLVWAGTADNPNDRNRSIALVDMRSLLRCDAEFVSLQLETRSGDEAVMAEFPSLRHFGGEIADFADTAALASLMDLVVCVDTSVAHLAGALGRPTWIMLPRAPDWRWMLDREDTPWYPTARLFRQSRQGDWPGVLGRVTDALRRFRGDAS